MKKDGRFANTEAYMEKHDFLRADKEKVRRFFIEQNAESGEITRNVVKCIDPYGILCMTGRGNLGIQDNYI